jgi:hypothetical protein
MNRQAPTHLRRVPRSGFALRKSWPRLLFLAVFCLWGCAVPASAQDAIDIAVVVFSSPADGDRISVAYTGKPKAEDIKQDFATLAAELGLAKAVPKISREPLVRGAEEITAGEAKVSGLTNWSTGAVNLDSLIQTFRRYGHFRATFFFQGNFPLQSPSPQVNNPPVRVQARVSGATVDYEVWIDQSKVGTGRLPSGTASTNTGPGWKLWVGVAAIALVVAIGAFLIVTVALGQRRRAQTVEGDP